MFVTKRRVALSIAIALPATGAISSHASAATAGAPTTARPTTTTSHRECAGRAQTAEQIRRGEVVSINCFDTFAEAMASVGITVNPDETPQSRIAAAQAGARLRAATGPGVTTSFDPDILAYHWDGANGVGENVYFVGTDCKGGGVNLAGTDWDNRIVSTTKGACSKVKHYDQPSWGSGSTQTTDPFHPNLLGSMTGATSSLSYTG